jgi:hypothetical protein
MKTLSQTWFADGYIDFELKKYTLLAYLQEISQHFTKNELYPAVRRPYLSLQQPCCFQRK